MARPDKGLVMAGKWSGGAANRYWQRPGSRVLHVHGDKERGQRIFAAIQHEPFWCDNCGGLHPLIEHRRCRAGHPFRSAFRGAT